jgi:hypothetical protein
MHLTAQLDAALEAARQQGFRIRSEWLGGAGGGACHLKGQWWMFLDLALEPAEQLEHVHAALALAIQDHQAVPAAVQLRAG